MRPTSMPTASSTNTFVTHGDDRRERRFAGIALSELDGWLPPCSRDPAAYADRGFTIVHRDPLEFRQLPSISEDLPPYSSCPAPYRWMREEFFQEVCETEDLTIRGPDDTRGTGWVLEPDRQRPLLNRFWGKLEIHKSLVFYYCNHGNPLDENTPRIVVGVGRIADFGEQLYFGTTGKYQDQYPVWSRRVTQAYPVTRGSGSRTRSTCEMAIQRTTSSAEFRGTPCFLFPMVGSTYRMTSGSAFSNGSSSV